MGNAAMLSSALRGICDAGVQYTQLRLLSTSFLRPFDSVSLDFPPFDKIDTLSKNKIYKCEYV
jgi:hypothetical protein